VRTHALKTCFGQPRAVTRLGTANCRRPFNSVDNKGCCA
jgi:hypothetical protein